MAGSHLRRRRHNRWYQNQVSAQSIDKWATVVDSDVKLGDDWDGPCDDRVAGAYEVRMLGGKTVFRPVAILTPSDEDWRPYKGK